MNKEKQKDKGCNKYSADLHKMELEMQNFSFSYLNLENLNVQVENESLNLYINYLKGV